MVGLILIMRRRLGGLEGSLIGSGLMKAILAGTLMSSAIWFWSYLGGNLANWIFTAGGIVFAVMIYGIGLTILKTKEIQQLTGFLQQQFGKN
jgi:hypothetical protein